MKIRMFTVSLLIWVLLAACAVNPQAAPTNTEVVLPAEQPSATATTEPTPQPVMEATPTTEPTPPMASLEDEQFDQALAQAFTSMDFSAIQALMGEQFAFATASSLTVIPAAEAIERLKTTALLDGAQPQAQFASDVPALLSGTDPLSLWGPVAKTVRALHVTGLGPAANEEAVLVIGAEAESGKLYFHGILLPPAGSFKNFSLTPILALETEVKSVLAKEDLNVRLGPGTDYASVGLMRSGEIAQVTGVSEDGAWWRIFCTNDDSGMCWITADPALSEPVSQP